MRLAAGAAIAALLLAAAAPAQRAAELVARMTSAEKLLLLHGHAGFPFGASPTPAGAIGSAGYVPGIPRLGIPALQETDAGLGIANPDDVRPGDTAVAFPSALATDASWDTGQATMTGAALGGEAASRGFNVLLGPGANLVRDPRGGRSFEYGSEDPLLAGTLAGAIARGIEDQHVIAVVKHFALNDQESGRQVLDAEVGKAAARESDLLAFEIAIERGHPGAVMCAYNRVNGGYACENRFLLDTVLKQDWRFPGFVMSDWGAVHSAAAATAGLDQESAAEFDAAPFFAAPLQQAVAQGAVPAAQIDNMAARIVGAMAAAGLLDRPGLPAADVARDLETARRTEAEGAVLLRNNGLLPLPRQLRRVLVVGGEADAGVLSGGGSSQVIPLGGVARRVALSGAGPEAFHTAYFDPPSPLSRIQAKLPGVPVTFDDGRYPGRAARLAKSADAVVIFATQWSGEMQDIPSLSLPGNQDALIAAVTAANPHTVVVLETGGAVLMPWLDRTGAVLEAWYPGSGGADAIADLLFGDANPSGRLPVTFPARESQLPRADVPGMYLPEGTAFTVRYTEGADVGYRWFAARGETPLFPFGFGLGYTDFAYSGLRLSDAGGLAIEFDMRNTGGRPGASVAQAYLLSRAGKPCLRLLGWERRELAAGETRHVRIAVDPRWLADYDTTRHQWAWPAGAYRIAVGASSRDTGLAAEITLPAGTVAP